MQNVMVPVPWEIKKIKFETDDTFTFKFVTKNKNFTFKPGQFNMLYLFGIGEIPISISGDSDKTEKLIHTIRNVGTVTREMAKLKKGDVLGLRGPFGTYWPYEKAYGKDIVIVAGGLGLAPLRPLIYKVLNERDKYQNVTILYGTRSFKNIIYENEIHEWKSRFDINFDITLDHGDENWFGKVGVITGLIKRNFFESDKTIAFVCGPEIMMKFSAFELEKKGIKEENIYVSLEKNMKCAVGFCGHCQFGSDFVCKDGPIFSYKKVKYLLSQREV